MEEEQKRKGKVDEQKNLKNYARKADRMKVGQKGRNMDKKEKCAEKVKQTK